jgi:hypothetical protein
MFRTIISLAALAGLGLALFAALVDGTGVTATPGAWLAVVGASATLIGLALLAGGRMGRGLHGVFTVLTVLAAGLTALAAWFLMQNILSAVMAVVCLGVLVVAIQQFPNRRVSAR